MRTLTLTESIASLRSAAAFEARVSAVEALNEHVIAHLGETIDLDLLCEAAAAMLDAQEATSADNGMHLTPLMHKFIDVARSPTIRQAAYGTDVGRQWIDSILKLIERTDFTVGHLFRQRATQYADKVLFHVPRGERVERYTFADVEHRTQQMARALIGLLGDDPVVGIFTANQVESAMFDLACLTNGIFNTLIPGTSVADQVQHILAESGAQLVVVSGEPRLDMVLAAQEHLPNLQWIVSLDSTLEATRAMILSPDDLLAHAKLVPHDVLDRRLEAMRSPDIATTMYTSGTTGLPKGITFSHANLVSKRYARATALPDLCENDVFVCYLPLYHTFGRWLELLGCIHLAATYVFAEDPSTATLLRNMRRFKPTGLISVPKKWRDLHEAVLAEAGGEPATDQEDILRETLSDLTGGQLRWGLSAAGRLDPDIFRFFHRHGVDLLSGYGMTEATGGITMTTPGNYVENSIGKALPGIELGFGEDQELLLRGPYVTPGYTDPRDNGASFRNGWFCTGDIVSRDADGYLRHVDRKKDIYKNASGRTIAPQRVEALFADFPEISRVFAVGDGREFVTLLIRPNYDCPDVALRSMGDSALREYFRALVVSCNRFLAPFERVVTFALLERDFSAAHGELTAKGSFRRAAVDRNFGDVIQPMYATSVVERTIAGMRVLIPVAFLQHLGVTETGTRAEADGLSFPAIERTLRIERDAASPNLVWVGNACYDVSGRLLDLDEWLRLPELWVGNAELTHLTKQEMLRWSFSAGDRSTRHRLVHIARSQVSIETSLNRLEADPQAAANLVTVHDATLALFSADRAAALRGADYLTRVMRTGRIWYVELAEARLRLAAEHDDAAVRGRAFVSLYTNQPADRFAATAKAFCQSGKDFLVPEACRHIASVGVKPDHWLHLSRSIATLRKRLIEIQDSSSADHPLDTAPGKIEPFVMAMLQSLTAIARQNLDFLLPMRRELVAWELSPTPADVRAVAGRCAEELASLLREHLGDGQQVASDPTTGVAITWGETLHFEDGLAEDHVARIAGAIQHTSLVRETMYVIYRNRLVDLEDFAPQSIWISVLSTRFGRGLYHAAVRLRSGERCDFVIALRTTADRATFQNELRMMIVASGMPGEAPLTPQVGGFWSDYDIATAEYLAGEPVEVLVHHMHEHPDRDVRNRLRQAWEHISSSVLTAAFEFYRRTEGQWILTGSVPRDVSVPLNDYDINTRIFSAAGAKPFTGALDVFLWFRHEFLDRIAFRYPALASVTDIDVVFDAALRACGIKHGLHLLVDALAEADRTPKPAEEMVRLQKSLRGYIERVRTNGYIPRTVRFARDRYHAWLEQVPEATVYARAAQLREIQRVYKVNELARQFPGSRLWLYAETVLRDIPPSSRVTLDHAIKRLREGAAIKDALGRLYTDLRQKLSSRDLQYFLARAAYPHLEPEQETELVSISHVGESLAELVTLHTDRVGQALRIRSAASSREIDTLHRIFYTGGLGGSLTANEQFLVVVDKADYVVGGLSYIRRTSSHTLLEKLAVMHRCRGRGIGRLLVLEFLRREAAEDAAVVSAQLFRRDWLEQFGFHSHPQYAGVVYTLKDA